MPQHPEILIARIDKGNIIVALNKQKYIAQMEGILSDSTTYEIVNYDPLKKIISFLTSISSISSWKQKEYIDIYIFTLTGEYIVVMVTYLGLTSYLKFTSQIVLRIVVSIINSPLFSIAVFLKNILHESLDKPLGFVINSNQLVKELNGFEIDPDYMMVSLYVTSLFTNVPIDLALESISRR